MSKRVILRHNITFLSNLFHTFFKSILKLFIIPITEPNFNTMVHLLFVCVGLVNHTNTRNIVTVVQSFTNQTKNKGFPEKSELVVVFLYNLKTANFKEIILAQATRK